MKGHVSRSARLQPEEEEEEEEEEKEEEDEEEWGRKRPGRGLPWTKLGRKPESSVCPVRRSRRLNPELGPWLTFTDEPMVPADPQGPLPSHLAPKAYDVEGEPESPTDEDSGQDQPLLRGPQIPALESPCESGCGDMDEDPSCPRLSSRGSRSWWSERGGGAEVWLTPLHWSQEPQVGQTPLPLRLSASLPV